MTDLQKQVLRSFHRLLPHHRHILNDLDKKYCQIGNSPDEKIWESKAKEVIESITELLNRPENRIEEVHQIINSEARELVEKFDNVYISPQDRQFYDDIKNEQQ